MIRLLEGVFHTKKKMTIYCRFLETVNFPPSIVGEVTVCLLTESKRGTQFEMFRGKTDKKKILRTTIESGTNFFKLMIITRASEMVGSIQIPIDCLRENKRCKASIPFLDSKFDPKPEFVIEFHYCQNHDHPFKCEKCHFKMDILEQYLEDNGYFDNDDSKYQGGGEEEDGFDDDQVRPADDYIDAAAEESRKAAQQQWGISHDFDDYDDFNKNQNDKAEWKGGMNDDFDDFSKQKTNEKNPLPVRQTNKTTSDMYSRFNQQNQSLLDMYVSQQLNQPPPLPTDAPPIMQQQQMYYQQQMASQQQLLNLQNSQFNLPPLYGQQMEPSQFNIPQQYQQQPPMMQQQQSPVAQQQMNQQQQYQMQYSQLNQQQQQVHQKPKLDIECPISQFSQPAFRTLMTHAAFQLQQPGLFDGCLQTPENLPQTFGNFL